MSLIPTTPATVDYRRKIAYELMKEGADGAPIQHWTQGLARLGQGALGGYEMYQADQKDKETEAEGAKAYLSLLQGSNPTAPASPAAPPVTPPMAPPAPPPPMAAKSPVVSALAGEPPPVAGPRPGGPVMPSSKVWGDAEAEAAGLYEPSSKPVKVASLGPVPMPAAPAAPPPAPVVQALAAPAAPAMSPADPASDPKAKIVQLLQSENPAARKMGKALADNYISTQFKPETTDEIKEYHLAVSQAKAAGEKPPSFIDFKTNLKKAGKPETTVNVGGGSDKQIFDAMDESAKAARTTATGLTGLREARNAINGGAITGAGANQMLGLQKLGAALGLSNSDKIVNTETFRSAIAPQVASVLKSTVGTANISNSDREFAEKAAGGNITLDEKSITRLLDIMERASTAQLEGHQKRLETVYSDADKYKRERALFGVDMPASPAIAAPAAPAPTAPDRAAIEQEMRRRKLLK